MIPCPTCPGYLKPHFGKLLCSKCGATFNHEDLRKDEGQEFGGSD